MLGSRQSPDTESGPPPNNRHSLPAFAAFHGDWSMGACFGHTRHDNFSIWRHLFSKNLICKTYSRRGTAHFLTSQGRAYCYTRIIDTRELRRLMPSSWAYRNENSAGLSRWERLLPEFLSGHRRALNVGLHLFSTPLSLLASVSLIYLVAPSLAVGVVRKARPRPAMSSALASSARVSSSTRRRSRSISERCDDRCAAPVCVSSANR